MSNKLSSVSVGPAGYEFWMKEPLTKQEKHDVVVGYKASPDTEFYFFLQDSGGVFDPKVEGRYYD